MNELIHKFELPECELIVIEKKDCLHFGTYLNDMQCEDTENKLLLSDLDYVNTLMAYKEVYEKGIDGLIKKYEDEQELIWHDLMLYKERTPSYVKLTAERIKINEIIQDLKSLKGE